MEREAYVIYWVEGLGPWEGVLAFHKTLDELLNGNDVWSLANAYIRVEDLTSRGGNVFIMTVDEAREFVMMDQL